MTDWLIESYVCVWKICILHTHLVPCTHLTHLVWFRHWLYYHYFLRWKHVVSRHEVNSLIGMYEVKKWKENNWFKSDRCRTEAFCPATATRTIPTPERSIHPGISAATRSEAHLISRPAYYTILGNQRINLQNCLCSVYRRPASWVFRYVFMMSMLTVFDFSRKEKRTSSAAVLWGPKYQSEVPLRSASVRLFDCHCIPSCRSWSVTKTRRSQKIHRKCYFEVKKVKAKSCLNFCMFFALF